MSSDKFDYFAKYIPLFERFTSNTLSDDFVLIDWSRGEGGDDQQQMTEQVFFSEINSNYSHFFLEFVERPLKADVKNTFIPKLFPDIVVHRLSSSLRELKTS